MGNLIASVQPGFACGKREMDGVIQLRMNNVSTHGTFVWDELTRIPKEFKDMSRYWIEPNDILFNNTNSAELVGKSALFSGYSEDIVYSNHFTRLRPNKEFLEPLYLSKWINSKWSDKTFEKMCNRWIGQASVSKTKLLEMVSPLPPIEEQRTISSILNEKMGIIEKLKDSIKQEIINIEAMPNSVLRKAFSGEL